MKCPNCGVELSLDLQPADHNPEEDDPLDPVVRKLEAERYGSPEPLPKKGRKR